MRREASCCASDAGQALPQAAAASQGVTSLRSLSRCCSQELEDALSLSSGSGRRASPDTANDSRGPLASKTASAAPLHTAGPLLSTSGTHWAIGSQARALPELQAFSLYRSGVQPTVSPPGQEANVDESLSHEASIRAADDLLDDFLHQAASSDSSAEWFSAARMQPHVHLSVAPQTLAPSSAVPSRKRGRPRRYDTTLPLGES